MTMMIITFVVLHVAYFPPAIVKFLNQCEHVGLARAYLLRVISRGHEIVLHRYRHHPRLPGGRRPVVGGGGILVARCIGDVVVAFVRLEAIRAVESGCVGPLIVEPADGFIVRQSKGMVGDEHANAGPTRATVSRPAGQRVAQP